MFDSITVVVKEKNMTLREFIGAISELGKAHMDRELEFDTHRDYRMKFLRIYPIETAPTQLS